MVQWFWDRSRRKSPQRLDQGQRARTIIKMLRQGSIVADVLDQHDPRPSAISISFLGRPARTSRDLARFAIAGDALIVPVFLLRGPLDESTHAQFTLIINQPIDHRSLRQTQRNVLVSEITHCCIQQIESVIMRAPEQWMWLHRRWKVAPKQMR